MPHCRGVSRLAAVGNNEKDGGHNYAFLFASLERAVQAVDGPLVDIECLAIVDVRHSASGSIIASHKGVEYNIQCGRAEAQIVNVSGDYRTYTAYAFLGLENAGRGVAYLVYFIGITSV